jgi:hypothetical protein
MTTEANAPTSYFERQGWEAHAQGKSRVTPMRGSMGADYRKGWDARAATNQAKGG